VDLNVGRDEFAVILTHSYEQDRALLRALLPADLRYLGILGPRHRTAQLIQDVAPSIGWTVAQCWNGLHSPVGLDLGTRDPASIALAITAELQATAGLRHVTVSRFPSADLIKK
jgi:xanthine/CO dehydrogenase XdhC/CoxF family maturation factor